MADQLSQDLASLKIDRAAPPSGRGKVLVILLAILAGLGALGYFVVYPKVKAALFTREVQTEVVVLISPSQAQTQLTATGYVIAQVSAKVAAKVPGRIAEIYVEEGQVIKRGDKVARLEDVDAKSAIAASRARASAARAKVAIARGSLAELEATLKRDKPLAEKGVIAKAPVDDLEVKVGSLQASIRAAEAETAAAEAEAKSLEVQLGSYVITSPIDGTVIDKLVEVGEGVAPGFGTPGVVELVDMTSLVVEVDVPEARLSQVVVDRHCDIVLDAYPAKTFRGAVKEIGRRVNRAKASVPVKVRFVDRPEQVLPEMAARVGFLSEEAKDERNTAPPKLVVPASAIAQRAGADVVFVVEDGEVRMTTVKLGEPVGEGRELLSQLPPGTKVVMKPPKDLADGEKVKEKK
jgi:RND family efflux transporter MFP subunit